MTGSGVDDVDMCASPFREQIAVGAYLILIRTPSETRTAPFETAVRTQNDSPSRAQVSRATRRCRCRDDQRPHRAMAHISLKHVQPGMVLAADAVATGNRLLLRAGSEITEVHLQTLRMWDVAGVDVQGVSREDVVARAAAQLDAATRDAIEAEIDTHFRFADRSHPLIDELVHLARLRMVLQASGDPDGA